jgi:hypothetical protein
MCYHDKIVYCSINLLLSGTYKPGVRAKTTFVLFPYLARWYLQISPAMKSIKISGPSPPVPFLRECRPWRPDDCLGADSDTPHGPHHGWGEGGANSSYRSSIWQSAACQAVIRGGAARPAGGGGERATGRCAPAAARPGAPPAHPTLPLLHATLRLCHSQARRLIVISWKRTDTSNYFIRNPNIYNLMIPCVFVFLNQKLIEALI